ncbi:MAG: DMT family transporter [Rubricella sp.]
MQQRPLLAGLWMLGATLSFSTMAVAGREIAIELDTFELMLYRSIIGVIVVVSLARLAGTLGQIERRDMGLHLFRNVGHFSGQNLWFYAVATVPLAQVFSLEFTTPIWVALAAPFFLGEKWTRPRVLAVTLGFAGILLVAQPGRVALTPGTIAAATCAIGFAISYVMTKKLAQRGHTTTQILFWLTVMQTGFGLVAAGHDGDIALPTAAGWPLVLVIALAGLTAHYCLTTALTLAPATLVAPMDFIRLPLIGFLGYALYEETVDPLLILGAAIIIGANLLNLRAETQRRNAPS